VPALASYLQATQAHGEPPMMDNLPDLPHLSASLESQLGTITMDFSSLPPQANEQRNATQSTSALQSLDVTQLPSTYQIPMPDITYGPRVAHEVIIKCLEERAIGAPQHLAGLKPININGPYAFDTTNDTRPMTVQTSPDAIQTVPSNIGPTLRGPLEPESLRIQDPVAICTSHSSAANGT
jgi:hypothetical protein